MFVQRGEDLLLCVGKHVALDEESDFRWRFNGSTNIVKVDADNKTTIFKSYKSREISVQNYTLCLKNVQKADSGRYTAFVSDSKEQHVTEYEVTVLGKFLYDLNDAPQQHPVSKPTHLFISLLRSSVSS